MKILLVHNTYQQPGGEDVVFRQEQELLRRAGHHVVTYCRSNWEIARLKHVALLARMVWAPDTKHEITNLIHREKPDLAHVHNTFLMVSPSVYTACKRTGTPVVQTLHNYRLFCPAANFYRSGHACEECVERGLFRSVYYGCYRQSRAQTGGVALMLQVHRLLRTSARLVDAFIALTEFARQKFIACGLPPERIISKPNFVYPDPGEQLSNGRQHALFVGRLSAEKGLNTLMAAWGLLGNRVPLKVIGDGPPAGQLAAHAGWNGLRSVCFEGRLGRAEASQAIKGARFLILPSECYENFPMSIAEAFACGVPVICSRLGAMQEIVADGRTGLHFTPGDPNDLAAKIEWAWTHPDEMAAMGRAARAEYEAKYTAERNYQMLMRIYEKVLVAKG